ncbi:hypothetical protein L9F63_011261, partial [Diploptera punctata]
MFRFMFIASLLLSSSLGIPGGRNVDGRIVGGQNASIENYPYQLALEYLGFYNCGAAIISENYAVTAAHCVTTMHASLVKMRAGTKEPAAGEIAAITGWGSTEYQGSYSPELQVVFVPIVDHEICNQDFMELYGGITKYMICTSTEQGSKDACSGDSGGPLAVGGKLAGIISWGEDCAPSQGHIQGRIVGGENASIENYPYMLSIEMGCSRDCFCGGSIISQNYALTSALCVNGVSLSRLRVRVGSSTVLDGGTVHNISAVHIHPYFVGGYDYEYDIAVIKLTSTSEPTSGEMGTVTGWGDTSYGGSMSVLLQVVHVPVIERELCDYSYQAVELGVTHNMICAGYEEGGKDACWRDGGGPMVIGGELAGIVSWGEDCASPNYPGVYTNVAMLRDFVVNITAVWNIHIDVTFHKFICAIKSNNLIVGGKDAEIEDYPYMLAMEFNGTLHCGGAIISEDYALTAAHCVSRFSGTPVGVEFRAGSSVKESGGTVHSASEIIIHPNFNSSTMDLDIAIIKVSTPFTMGSGVQPISLATTEPETGELATITGWGTTSHYGKESTQLQVTSIPIVHREVCNQDFMLLYGGITKNMICAGMSEGGKDACQSDSGGPMMVGGKLAGIISWGENCALPEYPGVYTNKCRESELLLNIHVPPLEDGIGLYYLAFNTMTKYKSNLLCLDITMPTVFWKLLFMHIKVIVSILISTCSGIVTSLDGRIVGGQNTTIEEYPYQLALEYFGWQKCGAVIISNDWALSAAHCVYRSQISLVKLRAGSSTRQSGGTLHELAEIIIHPDFNNDTNKPNFDVAVLKVSTPFTYGSGVQPIALTKTVPATGEAAIITGWGVTKYGGTNSQQLKVAFVRIIDHEICNQDFMELYDGITEYMICAGLDEGGEDACNSDSGGPMVVDGKLAGLISWGENCALPEYPGVYTNLAIFLKFKTIHLKSVPGRLNFRPALKGRIIGGENADIVNYPYQLSLEHREVHICGAVIISENWAVTAAHCVD